ALQERGALLYEVPGDEERRPEEDAQVGPGVPVEERSGRDEEQEAHGHCEPDQSEPCAPAEIVGRLHVLTSRRTPRAGCRPAPIHSYVETVDAAIPRRLP